MIGQVLQKDGEEITKNTENDLKLNNGIAYPGMEMVFTICSIAWMKTRLFLLGA